MPELPEVETIKRQLGVIVGKTVADIQVLEPKSFMAKKEDVVGKTVMEIGRKGKVLWLEFLNLTRDRGSNLGISRDRALGDRNKLFIHLKMSGQLKIKPGKSPNGQKAANKHLRVRIIFTDGTELHFIDQRKFGWVTTDEAVLPRGVDALDPALTPAKLMQVLQSSRRPAKALILDQSLIAGIGNIYASEILWQAKISPMARFKDKGLRLRREVEILSAIRKILSEAIMRGGTTMTDGLYQHVGGQVGEYWSRRRVYDREGEPCPRCRTKIVREVIAQRGTYWCPGCQK